MQLEELTALTASERGFYESWNAFEWGMLRFGEDGRDALNFGVGPDGPCARALRALAEHDPSLCLPAVDAALSAVALCTPPERPRVAAYRVFCAVLANARPGATVAEVVLSLV